ncbi:MAG: transglutaminase domain-containing protein [Planctomycetes bacterium]|nr:transglutaminase domain-containing protein [Planctomycetota bacterium]
MARSLAPRSSLLTLLLLVGCSLQEGAPERDEWHELLIGGEPAGYMRVSERRREGGGHVVTTTQKLVLRRGATVLDTEATASVEEDAEGRILGFRFVQKLSGQALEARGVAEGGELLVTETVGGQDPRTSRIGMDPRAVGLHQGEEILNSRLRRPGDQAEVVLFFPEARRFGTERALFEREEPVPGPGGTKVLRRHSVTVDFLPGLVTTEWLDEELQLQRSSFKLLGLEITTRRSTAREVLAKKLGSPPEVFFSTAIPVSRPVSPGAREAVYRIVKNEGSFPPDSSKLFPGAGHEVLRDEGPAARVLRVRRVEPLAAARRPVTPSGGLDELLRPNSFIQSDDRAIAEAAAKAAGGEPDAWKAALLLERWVYENVQEKNLNTAFATAKEVFAAREGDCTEHAVLLAALLRAAGVPARVVAGLVLYEGAFVGHMWTEAHVGEWVPLDATRGAGGVGPDHIALAASSLEGASVADFFLGIVPILGSVKIDVLEVTE